jgi:AcrR family transcriptional regulator
MFSGMSEQRTADVNRRSERARRAIHDATRELVGEQGFSKVTVEAIAARAGVGKQTIYRWWPSKCAIVLDVLITDNVSDHGSLTLPDSGDLAADVRPVLVGVATYFTDPANDKLLRAMTAEIQYDTDLAALVLDELLRPQFDAIVARIDSAGLTTPSGSPADPQIITEQLVGPIVHRWLLRRAPLDEDYINALVDHVVGASATKRPARRRRTSER